MSDRAPPAARLALVMIARNEAHQIGRALASALPWVDEAWVLDTGSTDDTVAVARAGGAQVAHFDWCDDFSAARNAALALTQADWRLVLDADEWLASGGPALAALRQQPRQFVGAVRVDSQQGDASVAQGSGDAPSWLSRVLPAGVAYAGRVHEQPQHTLPVRRLPIRVGHSGYAPAALAAKAGRNAALLMSMLGDTPDDAYLWYQLGKDHDVYERYADALQCFEHAQALLGPARPAWLHDLMVRQLHALKRCGRHADGLHLAEAGLEAWQDSPDFFFAIGDLLLDWAADEPTRADGLLPMIETAWQRCLAIGERPDLEGAVAGRGSTLAAGNLALLFDTLGQPRQAAHYRRLAQTR